LEKVDSISMARFLTQSQFRKLHDALAYKAERVGLPAPVEVPAAYTSQTCSKCGNKAPENRPKHDSEGKAIQDVFRCTTCGFEANADDNASEVIALRALHQQMNGGKFQKFDKFQEWLKKERVGTA
jgi:transposase